MYESFYNLNEKPFSLLPDPAFLYLSRQHSKALTMLEYGVASQAGFTVITGEIGCGKTTLIRKLIQGEDKTITVGLVNNTQCADIHELMCWIAFAFGLEFEGAKRVELHSIFVDFLISEYGAGRRVVLIIDEAQELGIELLEQVRMLSNINADKHLPIQFILSGQPELRDILRLPELVQFAQRIVVDYHLKALSQPETIDYIRFRLAVAGGNKDIFSQRASSLIWHHCRGIPRLINVLCDTSMVYGFSEQVHKIDIDLVEEVMADRSLLAVI